MLRAGGDPVSGLSRVTENLALLSAKTDVDDDLYMSPAMQNLLSVLRSEASIIMLISDGVRSSRSRALAASADVVITEVTQHTSRYPDVRLDSAMLDIRDLGVVFVTSKGKQRRNADDTSVHGRYAVDRELSEDQSVKAKVEAVRKNEEPSATWTR